MSFHWPQPAHPGSVGGAGTVLGLQFAASFPRALRHVCVEGRGWRRRGDAAAHATWPSTLPGLCEMGALQRRAARTTPFASTVLPFGQTHTYTHINTHSIIMLAQLCTRPPPAAALMPLQLPAAAQPQPRGAAVQAERAVQRGGGHRRWRRQQGVVPGAGGGGDVAAGKGRVGRAHTCALMLTYAYTHAHVHVHTSILTHTHKHTHTHTHTGHGA
jgi:hypothetical protein